MSILSDFATCVFCLLAVFVLTNEAVHRNLTYSVNPGCDLSECKPEGKDNTHLNVVVVQAVGEKDVIHYLWSTYRRPIILIAQTSRSATLQIDWENLLRFQEQAISFSEAPLHSVAFIINQLWEFNDEDDNADMKQAKNISSLGITNFYWDYINNSLSFGDTFITASPKSHNNESTFSNGGFFKIQFSISAKDMPSNEYPHLWFTSASSEMKIMFDRLKTSYKSSRFAAEVVAISSAMEDTQWHSDTSISFDDEYSPGVFKLEKLYSQCSSFNVDCNSFVTWKPVSYIGETPTVANSSDATASKYNFSSFSISDSIATSYFDFHSNVSTAVWNMTFGTSGDGFYKKTSFAAWSTIVGVGEPIVDKMSILATVVIVVGLGAPLIIMLGGGIYLAYQKCGKKEDDLLLEG